MIEWLERMDRMEGWTRGLPLSANQPAYLSIDPLTDLATIKPFRPEPFRAEPAYLPYQPTTLSTSLPAVCLPAACRCLPLACLIVAAYLAYLPQRRRIRCRCLASRAYRADKEKDKKEGFVAVACRKG